MSNRPPGTGERASLWRPNQSSSPHKCRFHLGFSLEFIRRLRRYAVHQNIQWVIVDNDPEPGCTILMESRRARLPEEKLTTQELTNIMKNLGIITREF